MSATSEIHERSSRRSTWSVAGISCYSETVAQMSATTPAVAVPQIPATPSLGTLNITAPPGPSTSRSQPTQTSDEPGGLRWAKKVLPLVINIATFGGSITFSVVIGEHKGAKQLEKVLPTFLALAYFFFILTLGLATAAQMALSFYEKEIKAAFPPDGATMNEVTAHNMRRKEAQRIMPKDRATRVACWFFVRLGIVGVIILTMLSALMFLSLSVAAYELGVGIASSVCTFLFILLFIGSWVHQWPALLHFFRSLVQYFSFNRIGNSRGTYVRPRQEPQLEIRA